MAKIKWNGGALLAPVPVVLVSCGTVEKPNVLTVAWTGIINSDPPKVYISVRPSRLSHKLIADSGEFVINMPSSPLIRRVDYCGVKSGRDTDKFADCALTPSPASTVSAPLIDECPVCIECKGSDVLHLGSHDMFIADIVAVNVEETLIDERGKLRMDKALLAAYAHGDYFALGKKIGSFGYSVKKKRERKPRK